MAGRLRFYPSFQPGCSFRRCSVSAFLPCLQQCQICPSCCIVEFMSMFVWSALKNLGLSRLLQIRSRWLVTSSFTERTKFPIRIKLEMVWQHVPIVLYLENLYRLFGHSISSGDFSSWNTITTNLYITPFHLHQNISFSILFLCSLFHSESNLQIIASDFSRPSILPLAAFDWTEFCRSTWRDHFRWCYHQSLWAMLSQITQQAPTVCVCWGPRYVCDLPFSFKKKIEFMFTIIILQLMVSFLFRHPFFIWPPTEWLIILMGIVRFLVSAITPKSYSSVVAISLPRYWNP